MSWQGYHSFHDALLAQLTRFSGTQAEQATE
jgi:hypothetical protein